MEFQSMKHLKAVPNEELPNVDGLSYMLFRQKQLNKSVYPKVLNNLNIPNISKDVKETMRREEVKDKLSKEYLLAIIRECCEALDMLNSKAWKDKRHKIDLHEFKFELIDIQHFINSLYDIWEMDRNEVLGIFIAKCEENVRRHENGY